MVLYNGSSLYLIQTVPF